MMKRFRRALISVALGTSPSSDLQLDLFFCPCVGLLHQRASGEKKCETDENKNLY